MPSAPAPGGGLGSTLWQIANYSPLGAFDKPAPPGDLGTTALWNKPDDVSWRDFMLAHLAKPAQQADDLVRGATNTFGLGDRFAAMMSNLTGVGGGDLAAQRQTSAARAQADPLYGVGQIAGYGPLGAAGLTAKMGGGVLGAMGEGATAGGLAALGHNTADTWGGTLANAGIGAAVGGATGVPVGLVSKAIAPGSATGAVMEQRADITDAAEKAKDDAFAALQAPKYDRNELLDQLDTVKDELYANDPDGTLPRAAPQSMKIFNDLYNQAAKAPTQSASALNDTIRDLDGPQGYGAGAENPVAKHFQNGLTNILQTLDPVTNHSPADVQGMLTNADDAYKTFKNAEGLQQRGQNLKAFGTSPASWAQNVAQKYYPDQATKFAINPNDPMASQYAALAAIANKAGGGGMTPYGVVHATRPLIEAGAGALGAGVGGPAGAVIGDALGGAFDYGVVKPMAGKALGAMAKRGLQTQINQSYPALTGQSITPPPDYAQALRSLIFSKLAGAGY